MMNQAVALSDIFNALSNVTRRAILEKLSCGPAGVTQLAKGVEMALPSFMQHLQVLEDCRLVRSHKQGRTRLYQLQPQSMALATHWLDRQRQMWETRLNQLDSYLLQMKESENDATH